MGRGPVGRAQRLHCEPVRPDGLDVEAFGVALRNKVGRGNDIQRLLHLQVVDDDAVECFAVRVYGGTPVRQHLHGVLDRLDAALQRQNDGPDRLLRRAVQIDAAKGPVQIERRHKYTPKA